MCLVFLVRGEWISSQKGTMCDIRFMMQVLKIREFGFHQVNANLLWPGTCEFAKWLTKHPTLLYGRRILELGRCVSASPLLYTVLPCHVSGVSQKKRPTTSS